MITDSVLRNLLSCFKPSRFKNFNFYQRQKILDKCEAQLISELSIENLLKRVKDSHAIVSNFAKTKELQTFLKYNEGNVILLTESDEERDAESSIES